jgi:hypothetical protein
VGDVDSNPNHKILGFMKVYGYFDASGTHEDIDSRGFATLLKQVVKVSKVEIKKQESKDKNAKRI